MVTWLSGSLDSRQFGTAAGWRIDRLARRLDGTVATGRDGTLVIRHKGDVAPWWLGSAERMHMNAQTSDTQMSMRAKRC